MLVDLAHSHRPSLDRVALLAVGSKLSLVNVSVAVCASLSHIGKDGFHVTLRTGHVLMHSAQGELSLIVIEFGDRADRSPSSRRVAILARHVQASVRAASHGGSLGLAGRRWTRRQKHGSQDEIHHDRRKHVAPSSQRTQLQMMPFATVSELRNLEEMNNNN